jgi:hypothetical protein
MNVRKEKEQEKDKPACNAEGFDVLFRCVDELGHFQLLRLPRSQKKLAEAKERRTHHPLPPPPLPPSPPESQFGELGRVSHEWMERWRGGQGSWDRPLSSLFRLELDEEGGRRETVSAHGCSGCGPHSSYGLLASPPLPAALVRCVTDELRAPHRLASMSAGEGRAKREQLGSSCEDSHCSSSGMGGSCR